MIEATTLGWAVIVVTILKGIWDHGISPGIRASQKKKSKGSAMERLTWKQERDSWANIAATLLLVTLAILLLNVGAKSGAADEAEIAELRDRLLQLEELHKEPEVNDGQDAPDRPQGSQSAEIKGR